MNYVFAPGCALYIYKPHLANQVLEYLHTHVDKMDLFLTCCQHDDNLPDETTIINVCSGCHKRYKSKRDGLSTISLWEMLADSKEFPFPNYNGMEISIQDPCPTRNEPSVHKAVRTLLDRMNIKVVEAEHTQTNQKCCGDSFYPSRSVAEVNQKMTARATQMPADDVCVYCVSCIKSMHIGGKTPRYLLDLLFNEDTTPGTYETDKWHAELDTFINNH